MCTTIYFFMKHLFFLVSLLGYFCAYRQKYREENVMEIYEVRLENKSRRQTQPDTKQLIN